MTDNINNVNDINDALTTIAAATALGLPIPAPQGTHAYLIQNHKIHTRQQHKPVMYQTLPEAIHALATEILKSWTYIPPVQKLVHGAPWMTTELYLAASKTLDADYLAILTAETSITTLHDPSITPKTIHKASSTHLTARKAIAEIVKRQTQWINNHTDLDILNEYIAKSAALPNPETHEKEFLERTANWIVRIVTQ